MLHHFNGIRCHPDVELTEPGLQLLLVTAKELGVLRLVLHVHVHAEQFVAVMFALVVPSPMNDLGFPGNAPNCCSNSPRVWLTKAFGTGCPSLNFRGNRNSKRRNLLIACWPFNHEPHTLPCQKPQRFLWHHYLARN